MWWNWHSWWYSRWTIRRIAWSLSWSLSRSLGWSLGWSLSWSLGWSVRRCCWSWVLVRSVVWWLMHRWPIVHWPIIVRLSRSLSWSIIVWLSRSLSWSICWLSCCWFFDHLSTISSIEWMWIVIISIIISGGIHKMVLYCVIICSLGHSICWKSIIVNKVFIINHVICYMSCYKCDVTWRPWRMNLYVLYEFDNVPSKESAVHFWIQLRFGLWKVDPVNFTSDSK